MEQTFDQAWSEIAGNFGDSPSETQSARPDGARAMLSVAPEGGSDVAMLKASPTSRIRPSLKDFSLAKLLMDKGAGSGK